jgi:hypothetical protein
MIPWSTVVAKTHDREQCNTFGDMESFSEMDTPLVGEGTPLESFTGSLAIGSILRSNKDRRFRLTSDDRELATKLEFKVLFSQVAG